MLRLKEIIRDATLAVVATSAVIPDQTTATTATTAGVDEQKSAPPTSNDRNDRNDRKGAEKCADALIAAQERARRAVLARLEESPSITRTFVNRWEDGNMVVTLAVRHVGTCELHIPGDRINADSLDDYGRLAACMLNAEGLT